METKSEPILPYKNSEPTPVAQPVTGVDLEKPATPANLVKNILQKPKVLICLVVVGLVISAAVASKAAPSKSATNIPPAQTPVQLDTKKRYTLEDILGPSTKVDPAPPPATGDPALSSIPGTSPEVSPGNLPAAPLPPIQEPPPNFPPVNPVPETNPVLGFQPPPPVGLSPERAAKIETELRTGSVQVLRQDVAYKPNKMQETTSLQGIEVRARIDQKIVAEPNTTVIAVLTEAVGGKAPLPAGSRLHGKVVGESDKRIYVEFNLASRPDGSTMPIYALARDGKDKGEGVSARIPRDWKPLMVGAANAGLPMIPFIGPRVAGTLQQSLYGNGYGYNTYAQRRLAVFSGGPVIVYFLQTVPPASQPQTTRPVQPQPQPFQQPFPQTGWPTQYAGNPYANQPGVGWPANPPGAPGVNPYLPVNPNTHLPQPQLVPAQPVQR
ncbi:MAG TPA: hypothetical protein PLB32_03685 [Acidobacteriota bacterium]|nr:hypothetical protein [Acidobacteriota bacterium]